MTSEIEFDIIMFQIHDHVHENLCIMMLLAILKAGMTGMSIDKNFAVNCKYAMAPSLFLVQLSLPTCSIWIEFHSPSFIPISFLTRAFLLNPMRVTVNLGALAGQMGQINIHFPSNIPLHMNYCRHLIVI